MVRKLFILFFMIVLCFYQKTFAQIITTFAGTGTSGYSGNGVPATTAQFYYPFGLTFDNAGNLYVADLNNNRVRKITPAGIISLVAGNGTAGYGGDGGPASAASLQNPTSMIFDSHGNLFITDLNNQRIRKVSSSGIISTIAGNGTTGFSGDGGPASAATLFSPTGITIDAIGNLFFCDQGNQVVRKIDTNGIITSVVGNLAGAYSGDGGPATLASIYAPNDVIVDGNGNLIISDAGNNRIRKVDTNGIITTIAGNGGTGFSGDGGPATAADIYNPVGLALDGNGNLLFAAQNQHRVRIVNSTGIINTLVGNGISSFSGDGGPATAAQLNNPCGVAISSSGDLYIADTHNDRIRKVACATFSSGIINGLSGVCTGSSIVLTNSVSGGSWSSSTTSIVTVGSTGVVTGIASGTCTISYAVTNSCGTAVATKSVTVNSTPTITLGANPSICRGATTASLPYSSTTGSPTTYTIDWTSTALANGFTNIGSSGVISTIAGNGTWGFSGDGGAATSAELTVSYAIYGSPNAVAVDRAGNLLIADFYNNRIRKVHKSTGIITTIAGTGSVGYSGDGGPASVAQFNGPFAIVVDTVGNIYIGDGNNYVVRKINASGIITTIAGNGIGGFSGDGGPATAAKIKMEWWGGLKVDNASNLYIADIYNHRVRKVNISGIISTIAGNSTMGYSGDGGPATAASLSSPGSIDVDDYGNLYLTENDYNVIRKVDSSGFITTYAGNGTSGYSGDGGPASAASFWLASGISLDKFGNLYVNDQENDVIRKIDQSGIITTVAGTGTRAYSGDGGQATASALSRPISVVTDTFGNLYITEADFSPYGKIRKVNVFSPLPASPIPVSVPASAPAGVYTGILTVSNNSCTSTSYSFNVTVDTLLSAGTISGASSVNMGSTTSLSNAASGGTWSSSTPTFATVGSTGVVTGLSPGIDTIRYTVTNSCGTASTFKVITVNPIAASPSCRIVTTIAGTGVAGYTGDGGPATTAQVRYPIGVTSDRAGNIYFADYVNQAIRKIDTTGIITTLAGGGSVFPGDGGPATAVYLQQPWDIITDTSGNTYFTDADCIRKISNSGIISTFAGSYSSSGFAGDGGPASAARFNGSFGLAIDALSNIYVGDATNHRIRKISSAGIVSTVAGDGSTSYSGDGGPATAAGLLLPLGITVDDSLNIYFTDGSARVRKVSNVTGIISTVAGTGANGYSGDSGPATSAQLNGIFDVTVDRNNNVYIADYSNNRIRKVDSFGIISTVAGNGTGGFNGDGIQASLAQIYQPIGMCITLDGSTLLFSDWQNHRVRKISNPAAQITGPSTVAAGSTITLSTTSVGGTWSSSSPSIATVGTTGVVTGVTPGVDTIRYTITNTCGTAVAVKIVTVTALSGASCNIITTFAGNGTAGFSGDGGSATVAQMNSPVSVAVDGSGNVYIADANNNRIRKVSSSGIVSTFAGNGTIGYSGDGGPATSAQIYNPGGITADGSGNIFIADAWNHCIRKINSSNIITTFAGIGSWGSSGDGGPASAARLNNPSAIAIDGSGNVYIADQLNHRIRKVSTSGVITTFAGTGLAGYSGDGGPATLARLNYPSGIAVDGSGNIYVADHDNSVIRKISNAGIITTFAGTGAIGYSGDGGAAAAATLGVLPPAVAVDGSGNVYIADQYNNVIRKVDNSGIITTIVGNGYGAGSGGSIGGYSGDGGAATMAQLFGPSDVKVDGIGNIYIADHVNHRIRKVSLSSLPVVSAISGAPTICVGSAIVLSDSTLGGAWSSSNTATATVGSLTGIVTGVSSDTVTISYTVTNACGTATATKTITVTSSPSPITGTTSVCTGATTTLNNTSLGGTWSSSNPAVATIGSASGIVTGVTTGTATITYSLGSGCQATTTVTVLALPAVPAISGSPVVCIGTSTTLSNSMPGGFWYSTDVTKATVTSPGIVTGVAAGSVSIVYAVSNACGIGFNSVFVTVNPASPISGPSVLCTGSSVTFSNSTPGGTWTSSNTSVATVGSSSGVVTGLTLGTTTITYTLSPGCYSTHTLTVNSSSASILGANTLCISLSTTLSGTPSGGVWSSSNPAVATIGSLTGTVIGIAPGVANITYTRPSGCYVVHALTVNTSAGPITGVAGVCTGFTTTLLPPVPGGSWSSASTFYATVGSITGVVYGASPGTSLITYSLGPGCLSTITVTVRPLPAPISVVGGGTMCAGGPGINIGMPGSAVGIDYQLYRSGLPVGASVPGTGTSLSFGLHVIGGTYTVIATDPVTLCERTMPGGALITVFPPPMVSASPGVSVCAGTSTILTASGALSYTWSPATGLTSTAVAIVTANPSVTTTYTVTGINSFGCSNAATVTVTVNPLPTITAGSGVAICNGGTTTLSASGGSSYTWSPGTGLSATTGVSVIASPTTTRTYTVTGTGSGGCTNRATVTVTVSALPAIMACPGVSICSGSSTTISASGGVTYQWSPPVGLSATTGISITASPTVTTTYTVTGTNGTGCFNLATVTVTVNSLPTISASSGGAICNGSSTTLTASGGITYTWAPSAGLSSTTGATVAASPSVTTTYTVTGTNVNGCNNRANVTATINFSPSAISTTGNLCVGNSVTLTNATSGGVWSSSNPTIATIGSLTGTVTGLASGTTTISYTLSSGCRAIMVVTVAALPSAISGPGTIFTGATATYSNATSGGLWSSSNTSIVTVGSVTGIATGVATGAATISYTVTSGCRTTLLVSVSATPTTFSVTGGGIYCFGGAAVPIGLSGSQLGVVYRLYIGSTATGTPISGTGGPITFGTFTAAGTYTVIANPTSSSPVTMSGSATVTVISSTMLPAPVAVLGGGTMCSGGPGLAITMPGSAVSVNYQLYRNGIITGSPLPGVGTSLSFGLHSVPGTYTVIGTSTVNGCSRVMTGGANITVYPTPNVYSVTGGGSFCSGVGGVVVGLSNSQSGINYQLYNGTSTVGSLRPGTGAAFNFSTVTASGTYSVVGIGSYCTANMSGTVTVSANPVPTVSGTIYTVAPAGSISLSGSISGGVWTSSNTGVATIGSSSGIVTGATLGSSTISYTLPTGCRGTRVIYVTPTGHRGISDDSSTYALFARRIYVRPNPNSGVFWVSGDFSDETEATLEVFNMLGQKIYSRVVRLEDGKLDEEILLENIANGTYLLNVSSASYRDMFHIVVTR